MFEIIETINSIISEFIIFIILALAGLIGEFIRRKYNNTGNKLDKMQSCLDTQNARGVRTSKAIIDLAEHMDIETTRLHPTKPKSLIKPRTERNLVDIDGNL